MTESEKQIFCVKMAGLRIGIRTGSRRVKHFFRDYIDENWGEVPCDFLVEALVEEKERTKEQLIRLNGEESSWQDWYLEVVTLHMLIAEKLPFYDVILMHGSAIALDGQGYIFTAPSGTGKSTHTALWRGLYGNRTEMINDDKPFLICREDGIYVCGSPWMGKHGLGANKIVPLKAIALVHRAEDNHIEEVGASQIFEFLFQQVYQNRSNVELSKKTLLLIVRIVKQVKLYELFCNMDSQAAEIAYKGMC